ncbi:hypothetical protein BGZ73_003884 [Actinomortierella ambigua]|nr:hypothetical protein BGZ73_003884 [Actinomortierella ambigua]
MRDLNAIEEKPTMNQLINPDRILVSKDQGRQQSQEAAQKHLLRSYSSQQSFLLMLARLRHVVLQDAAEYMYILEKVPQFSSNYARIPFFDGHEVFDSGAFRAFRDEVWANIDSCRTLSKIPDGLPTSAIHHLQHLDHAVMTEMATLHAGLVNLEKCIRELDKKVRQLDIMTPTDLGGSQPPSFTAVTNETPENSPVVAHSPSKSRSPPVSTSGTATSVVLPSLPALLAPNLLNQPPQVLLDQERPHLGSFVVAVERGREKLDVRYVCDEQERYDAWKRLRFIHVGGSRETITSLFGEGPYRMAEQEVHL